MNDLFRTSEYRKCSYVHLSAIPRRVARCAAVVRRDRAHHPPRTDLSPAEHGTRLAMATSAETAERIEQLQGMILEGQPNTVCLTFARQTWGVSRAQGYRLLKKAWAQTKDDIEESGIDRQELLSWSIQMLMAAAGQAMKQNNPGAVVGAIRQLDHMTGTGYNSHRSGGVRR